MAHEKIYGICEDKCRVPIAKGISEEIVDDTYYSMSSVGITVPENGVRKRFTKSMMSAYLTRPLEHYEPGYCAEIVVKLRLSVSKPEDFLNGSNVNAKFLNGNLGTSKFTTLIFRLTHDGFNLCIWCMGYAY